MKKFISVLLTITLILVMTATAFADSTTLRILDASARSYDGYQLLTLTIGLKTGEHHPETCDGNHADDCYNYSYAVKDKYREVLQAEVFANGGNYLWNEGNKPATYAGVTDDMILKYLENQSSDAGDTYGTLRQVADRVYRAIQEGGLEADVELDSASTNLDQGYWMIVDVTDLSDKADAQSLVMVDTKGAGSITITPKVAIPTVEKKVKDIDDSEDSNIVDNAWMDSADHDIGDVVPFKLTAVMPSNARAYSAYKLVFHDTLSEGLTFNSTSVKVYMYETKHKAEVDTDLNDGKDVTANFVVNASATDSCGFEVSCENVLAIEGAGSNVAFVVYYEATLNDKAVMGVAGNPNEVYLEFSNEPYGDGTGKTEKDKVVVFTYQVIVNKVDSHGHALEGAGFTLYKKALNKDYEAIGEELKGDEMTTFTWGGLDDGDYKLVESTVPAGYNQMTDIQFSISATHSENAPEPTLLTLDGGLMGEGIVTTGTITKDIVNNTGTVLPETGAEGTVMLIGISSLVVMMAAVFMITRKKMSVYED